MTLSDFLSYWDGSVVPDLIAAMVLMPLLLIGLHMVVSYAKKAVDGS